MKDILIVDDDLDMAETVKAVLDSEGYTCRCAGNGKLALAEVAISLPAAVLLDMLMPVMNGWDCARELRTHYGRELPIIVMTAAEHAGARRDEVGADEVLSKPFDLRELLRVVARYQEPPARAAASPDV